MSDFLARLMMRAGSPSWELLTYQIHMPFRSYGEALAEPAEA